MEYNAASRPNMASEGSRLNTPPSIAAVLAYTATFSAWMAFFCPPNVGASASMMSPSTHKPTRLSPYDTTMFTSPETKGTRMVTPKPPKPISDMPMKPHTAGMAARIMA